MKSAKRFFIYFICLLLAYCSKNKENNNSNGLPAIDPISTSAIIPINAHMALISWSINSNGNSSVTSKGVCWSTSPHPTINDNKTVHFQNNQLPVNRISNLSYSDTLTGLVYHTTYYLRVYATNNSGTAYSNEVSFTSNGLPYYEGMFIGNSLIMYYSRNDTVEYYHDTTVLDTVYVSFAGSDSIRFIHSNKKETFTINGPYEIHRGSPTAYSGSIFTFDPPDSLNLHWDENYQPPGIHSWSTNLYFRGGKQ